MSTLINGCCVLPGSPPRVPRQGLTATTVKAVSIWRKGSSASASLTVFEILKKLCFVFSHPLDSAPPSENRPATRWLTEQNPSTSEQSVSKALRGLTSAVLEEILLLGNNFRRADQLQRQYEEFQCILHLSSSNDRVLHNRSTFIKTKKLMLKQ